MKLEVFNINGKSLGREVELSDDIYNLELNENHEHVVYLAVKQYLAHQRQGTHKAKERNEVKGSTRKLHRQKGTGGSRKGAITNPLYRGGGRVFGPRPRDYDMKLNKKVKRLARVVALSTKAQSKRILVIEDFKLEEPKTKSYLNLLKSFSVEEGCTLAEVKSILMLNVPTAPEAPATPKKPFQGRGRKKALYPSLKAAYVAELASFDQKIDGYEAALTAHEEIVDAVYTNIALSCRNIPNADVINAKDFHVYQVMNADYIILTESAVGQLNEALNK